MFASHSIATVCLPFCYVFCLFKYFFCLYRVLLAYYLVCFSLMLTCVCLCLPLRSPRILYHKAWVRFDSLGCFAFCWFVRVRHNVPSSGFIFFLCIAKEIGSFSGLVVLLSIGRGWVFSYLCQYSFCRVLLFLLLSSLHVFVQCLASICLFCFFLPLSFCLWVYLSVYCLSS